MAHHLRSLLKITWKDKVTNKEVLDKTGLPSMEDILIWKNLPWTGHLIRMPNENHPRQILFSQLSNGRRKRGRPRLYLIGSDTKNTICTCDAHPLANGLAYIQKQCRHICSLYGFAHKFRPHLYQPKPLPDTLGQNMEWSVDGRLFYYPYYRIE